MLTSEKYSIQQVAMMTGLSKQVIRKWEDRHKIVQPTRLPNGYRQYTFDDVQTLLEVKNCAGQGYSLKQCVELLQSASPIILKNKRVKEPFDPFVLLLLEQGALSNDEEITILLHHAYNQYGLERFLKDVIIPFLQEVGHRWEQQVWGEYQEALASLAVRDFLVQVRRNFLQKLQAPLLLGACLPEEQHEIPILIVLLQMMMKGFRTAMIGASPAIGAIQSLIEKLQPSIVFLSATTTTPFEEHPQMLTELDQFAARHVNTDFFLGGQGAEQQKKKLNLQAIKLLPSIDDHPFSSVSLAT